MPIKIPKGFTRRKTSGNALDEVENTPAPSFRVLERPVQSSKSFDGGSKLVGASGRLSFNPPLEKVAGTSFGQARSNSNRGSGGSNANSTSTAGYHDNASSSRLSTSSTVPSSLDTPAQDDLHLSTPHQKPLPSTPAAPTSEDQPAFTVKAGGRTFSFGSKTTKVLNPSHVSQSRALPATPEDSGSSLSPARTRATTQSSYASTATPPKLEADLVSSDLEGLTGIFDSIGKRRSVPIGDGQLASISMGHVANASDGASQVISDQAFEHTPDTGPGFESPSSVQIDRSQTIEPSAYSWGSRMSTDELMDPSSPLANAWLMQDSVTAAASPHGIIGQEASSSGPTTPEQSRTPRTRHRRQSSAVSGGLKRSSAFMDRRSTRSVLDEDARLLSESVSASKTHNGRSAVEPPGTPSEITPDRGCFWDSRARSGSPPYTPSRATASVQPGHSPETTIQGPAQRTSKFFAPTSYADAHDEFRESQGLSGSRNEAVEDKARQSGADTFENDKESWSQGKQDNVEHGKGREPQHGVPLQPAMQTSREQPSDPPSPGLDRSPLLMRSRNSMQGLLSGTSSEAQHDGKSSAYAKSSDDEDEDIPLGILAAHGFPNKNRAPGRLSIAGSTVNLPTESQPNFYPAPPGSVTGAASVRGGRTSTLPVFARSLPHDPYQGVRPMPASNRDSLAFGQSTFGMKSQSSIPPGGLVGVIAGEERAKAMRRGNPYTQGGYGLVGGSGASFSGNIHESPSSTFLPTQSPGIIPGMRTNGMAGPAMMGGLPLMSPTDQAQMQMTQQMTEMMQIQMQWMQQMMQMQGLQGIPNAHQSVTPQPMGSLAPPAGPEPRPASAGSIPASRASVVPPTYQRSMSMLDSAALSASNGASINVHPYHYVPSFRIQAPMDQGYAPSIAPSERSNVGLPSRYRPVSIGPSPPRENGPPRASTFTSGTVPDWSAKREGGVSMKSGPKQAANVRRSDDDDDDEGWEDMKKRRDKTQSRWRFKKASSTTNLEDVFVPDT